jgi:hypothetical protein
VAKKKKARVPAPPKRVVQAPKTYHAPRDPRRTRLIFIAVGAAIVVAAAVVGLGFLVRDNDALANGPSGTCLRQTFPPQGRQHVRKVSESFEYSSVPPTSGPHYGAPLGPAVWSVYDRPLDQSALVHNLEHGGVVVQYGSGVPQTAVQQLVDWYGEDPRGLVIAPLPPELEEERPELENTIALTAWTHLMTCPGFDKGALDTFLDDYRGPGGDAPEKFELDALQPGGQ